MSPWSWIRPVASGWRRKPLAPLLWDFEEVADHWDAIVLRSFAEFSGEELDDLALAEMILNGTLGEGDTVQVTGGRLGLKLSAVRAAA